DERRVCREHGVGVGARVEADERGHTIEAHAMGGQRRGDRRGIDVLGLGLFGIAVGVDRQLAHGDGRYIAPFASVLPVSFMLDSRRSRFLSARRLAPLFAAAAAGAALLAPGAARAQPVQYYGGRVISNVEIVQVSWS